MPNWLLNTIRVVRMSTNALDKEHLFITAKQTREKVASKARVVHTRMLSESVKSISLKVENPEVQSKAGQWVDFFVPSLPNSVGGYSIFSSVERLKNDRILDLAIKISDYPTAKWIHEKCEVDSEVSVRVGGDFIYDPETEFANSEEKCHDLLLVAGGVGINPIFSILQQAENAHRCRSNQSPNRVHLLYSAKTLEDLIFMDSIADICKRNAPNFMCHYHVTQPLSSLFKENRFLREGRINLLNIEEAISNFEGMKIAYVCGPLDMLNFVKSTLRDLNFTEENIRFEKWF